MKISQLTAAATLIIGALATPVVQLAGREDASFGCPNVSSCQSVCQTQVDEYGTPACRGECIQDDYTYDQRCLCVFCAVNDPYITVTRTVITRPPTWGITVTRTMINPMATVTRNVQ
ncbi:hypothetical protein FPQ18DRAFT_330425 [Pyronema domesticum]|nr:hypothetical protein FPQ18DRAFT_330425 [Pyronema domesticum]